MRYERESVPFKGVDELVERLASYVSGLPKQTTLTLIPRGFGCLTSTFPVLLKLIAVGGGSVRASDLADPVVMRSRMFLAMRELIQNLARTNPLVISLDDLQWADKDSIALISELLVTSEPLPLLLVATQRSTSNDEAMTALMSHAKTSQLVELAPLTPSESKQLVERVGHSNAVSDPLDRWVARRRRR
jgi:eukaryotic-like serine/threonine-protein kinase